MHREIMKPPKGMDVDHKNHNKLDNTRESLRVCTHAENKLEPTQAAECNFPILGRQLH